MTATAAARRRGESGAGAPTLTTPATGGSPGAGPQDRAGPQRQQTPAGRSVSGDDGLTLRRRTAAVRSAVSSAGTDADK